MTDLYNLRRDFTLKSLDEHDILPDPISMVDQWLNEAIAAQALEPNAMTLSTSTINGKPSSRVVLLKQIKPDGFVFFTNYESRKALQIEENKYVALNFVWHEMERQVRIEGIVEKIPAKDSDAYFEVRPTKSKLGAWASPQSQPIPNRTYLENLIFEFEQKYEGKEIPRPSNWGGYIVKPHLVELWQGRSNRLHDRLQYKLTDNNEWKTERLAP
jgi:pyridoxamine 5'-phosphate oxidase